MTKDGMIVTSSDSSKFIYWAGPNQGKAHIQDLALLNGAGFLRLNDFTVTKISVRKFGEKISKVRTTYTSAFKRTKIERYTLEEFENNIRGLQYGEVENYIDDRIIDKGEVYQVSHQLEPLDLEKFLYDNLEELTNNVGLIVAELPGKFNLDGWINVIPYKPISVDSIISKFNVCRPKFQFGYENLKDFYTKDKDRLFKWMDGYLGVHTSIQDYLIDNNINHIRFNLDTDSYEKVFGWTKSLPRDHTAANFDTSGDKYNEVKSWAEEYLNSRQFKLYRT